MNRGSVLGTVLLAASSAMAQAVYSPPRAGASEGILYSYYFGRYANARYMMVDGHHPSPAVYTSIALRLDGRSHTSSTARGRSWSDVTVSLSPGNLATFSRTFSANITSTPTRVHSGSVNWATQIGRPTNSPATWGGNGAVFPFGAGGSSPTYFHISGDILIDTMFSGGKMASGGAWTGSTSFSYFSDGYGPPTSQSAGATRFVPTRRLNRTVTMPCNDSRMVSTTGAYTMASAISYGGAYSIINYRNHLRWYSFSFYCGYDNPVIHAVGLKTLEPGVDVGTGCNKLHVASIAAFYTYVTLPQSVNSSGYTGYRYVLIPHTAGLVGIKTITQGAFSDTRDNSFRLTQAMEVTIPAVMPRETARRLATYHFLPTSTAGLINPNGSYLYNPILRWTR